MSNGTAGNRKGYKVFSINTTIRNPKRNKDFLTIFEPFNGKVFDDNCSYRYLYELIKHGVYQVSDISSEIKNKWENDIELTPEEIRRAIDDNPQACGLHGRVMTQLRAIKDQGFLIFTQVRRGTYKISLTKLGWDIVNNIKDPTIAYTKAMLGLHAKSPSRDTIFNEARPFLNTLFVIETVNKKWKELGNTPKGILLHEFAVFVLSMKDCDYESAAQRIINYRLRFRFEANKEYLESYLESEDILPLKFNSLVVDYPDEVFRKFEMTGLLKRHGSYYTYIDFSSYNYSKVQEILKAYKGYKWINFTSTEEYYAYLENQTIPWEDNEFIRHKVVEEKAKVLGITLNTANTLEQNEEYLDRMFYTHALKGAVERYDYSFIGKELLILAKRCKEESKLDSISEPLRLEYLLALYFGKRYGLKGLISNIIYNEDGLPLHCAAGGKSDIIFHSSDGSYILEPTMITSKAQQLNNETSNIVRHVQDEESKSNLHYRVMMIAPRVHEDVARYFRYEAKEGEAKIAPVTIERTVGLFKDSETLRDLGINYDQILDLLVSQSVQIYTDTINAYRVSEQTRQTQIFKEPTIEPTITPLHIHDTYHPGRIPLYTLRAACGRFEDNELPVADGWVDASGHGFTPDKDRYFAVHAKGDSMLPLIHDGDICVFEWYTGGSRKGEIVLMQIRDFDPEYDGRYTIKRYDSEKIVTEDYWEHKSITLSPYNPAFEPIVVREDESVRTIGIFKCTLS